MANEYLIIGLIAISLFLIGCSKQEIIYSGHLNANEIYGDGVVYNDMVSSIISSRVGTQAPIFDEIEKTFYMDDSVATVNEDYFFIALQVPHGYKEGSNISCHLHAYESTRSAQNYTLELNYTWYNINEVSTTTYLITKNFTVNTPEHNNTVLSFGEIDGTNKKISSTFKAKITRKANDPSTQNLYVDFFDCHYQANQLGSFAEYTK